MKTVETLEEEIERCKEAISRYKVEARDLSEKIGNNPSQESLERQRKIAKESISTIEDAIKRETKAFGNTVSTYYPNLLISRIVEQAQLRIGLKVEEEVLMPGLTKELVLSLLNESTCLCGNPIHEKEHEELEKLRRLFPPLSYKHIYDQFKSGAIRWSAEYDSTLLLNHLESIFKYREQIELLHKEINNIEEQQKQGTNVDSLIAQRATAEANQQFWTKKLEAKSKELGFKEQVKKQRKKKLDELLDAFDTNKAIEEQIGIMEAVRDHFSVALKNSTQHFSKALCNSIQQLISEILTSTRQVSMTERFELSVKDSFGDEAKSESRRFLPCRDQDINEENAHY